MACKESDFKLREGWKTLDVNGHKLEVATAEGGGILPDVLFRLDGVFQGVVGSEEAAVWWVGMILTRNA